MSGGRHEAAIGNAAFVLALRERGLRDTAVLRAMEQVPRERFAPQEVRAHARRDIALPLPCGQSMTAPTTIGTMLTALALRPGLRVLEIGTGSGYTTALLHRMGAAEIWSLERCARLVADARAALGRDHPGCRVALADGLAEEMAEGIAESGAVDRVLVNGLVSEVPRRLVASLAPGGILVAVTASEAEPRLLTVRRDADGAPIRAIGQKLRLPPLQNGLASVS